jgi:hypothetical protein
VPHPIEVGAEDVIRVEAAASSASSLALHDLQLSQVKPEWFRPLTEPVEIFRFKSF